MLRRTNRICCTIAVLAFAISFNWGQEKKVPQLPEFTAEQRWARAEFFADLWYVTTIGYAKSVNHTADDVSQYCVKLFAPSWGKPDSVSPMRVFRGMRRNLLAWKDWKIELIDSVENKVVARFNKPYVARYFKNNASLMASH